MLGNWSHKEQEAKSKLSHPVSVFLFALFLSLLSHFSSSSHPSLYLHLHFLPLSLASTLPPLHPTLPSFLLLSYCLLFPSLTLFLAILLFSLPFHSTFPIPLSFSPITLALPFCLVLPLSLFLCLRFHPITFYPSPHLHLLLFCPFLPPHLYFCLLEGCHLCCALCTFLDKATLISGCSPPHRIL